MKGGKGGKEGREKQEGKQTLCDETHRCKLQGKGEVPSLAFPTQLKKLFKIENIEFLRTGQILINCALCINCTSHLLFLGFC